MPYDDVEQFWRKHFIGGPNAVCVVHAVSKSGADRLGIFSSLERARDWSESLPVDEITGCIFTPYVIDIPEYGNISRSQMA